MERINSFQNVESLNDSLPCLYPKKVSFLFYFFYRGINKKNGDGVLKYMHYETFTHIWLSNSFLNLQQYMTNGT